MSRHAAIEYLRVPAGAPWKWEEQGGVVVWHDGTTILFREELTLLLERLVPTGLPPFPSLVLLLAACRGKLPQGAASHSEATTGQGQLLLALEGRRKKQVDDGLGWLARLPAELIARPAGKALLAEAVFERGSRHSEMESARILIGWKTAGDDTELNRPQSDAAPLDLDRTLDTLVRAVGVHTAESLTRRLRTGLDALPGAASDLDLPHGEQARRLVEALGSDETHAGLALIVRDLMAALRLPQTLAEADELAGGGASDISNRGPLDRLLLSELAHDDLTLAVRVALNEALYLRREPPARQPERTLAVLFDSGLRMWGVPRVLGVAAALALTSRHPAGGAALAWRAEGRTPVPVDLLTKAGLESHLAALLTELHPGAALPAWQAALAEHAEVDVVIVTHRDALADPVFQRQLALVRFDRGFVVLVERDGLVQLHALPVGSPRPLAQVQVDVEKLFTRQKHRAAPAPLVTAEAGDFPAIFRKRPFPLLLPVNAKMDLAVWSGKGGLCVTSDRRLLAWERHDLGARQLAVAVPAGRACWLRRDAAGRVILVKGRDGGGRMSVLIVPVNDGEPRLVQFAGPHHPLAVSVAGDALLVVLHTRVVVVSLVTAEVLAEAALPEGMKWISGCYFSGVGGLFFVNWSGMTARWDSLVVGRGVRTEDVLTIFDRDGIGAWVVLRDGRLLSPTGTEAMNAGFAVSAVKVSEDGGLVAVGRSGTDAWSTMNLTTKSVAFAPKGIQAVEKLPVIPPTRTLQNRFSAIWGRPGQPLRLQKSRGGWVELFCAEQRTWRLVESALKDEALQGDVRPFESVTTPLRFGCTLRVASWPGGSKAWLDSRGLLHLRSHDAQIPEITLALCHDAAIASWCSDGQQAGPAFYHGPDGSQPPGLAPTLLEKFCQRLC